MKKLIFIIGITISLLTKSQIYQESRYQLMLNYKFKEKNTISFQPEMRVNNFVEKTTTTLWRLAYIRTLSDKHYIRLGFDWFNNWHNFKITREELRPHIEAGFKDKYGKWVYSNRYRIDYRNFYTDNWNYVNSTVRIRYLINWSRDLFYKENGQKLTLNLANEVFLNVASTKSFKIFNQNRLGGYLVYKLNDHVQIRSTYWWEYLNKGNYNHQWWIQLGYDF